uniref:ABC transporter substrate-binding protein n=1 Tax=candidate division WOR-3 bacterium TaxID=2052148 RepID=A0A7C4Y4S3_UNCW3
MKKIVYFLLLALPALSQVALLQWSDEGFYKELETKYLANLQWNVDVYNIAGNIKELPNVVSKIKQREYKIVIVIGDEILQNIVNDFNETPVIFLGCSNTSNIIKDKKNFTGIEKTISSSTTVSTIIKILPNIKKVGIIFKEITQYTERLSKAFNEKGIEVEKIMAENPGVVNTALKFLTDVDLIIMVPDELNRDNATFKFLLMYSTKSLVPIMGIDKPYVKTGALFCIGIKTNFIAEKGAEYTKKILNGIPPSELPVLFSEASYTINLKVAEKYKINIDENVLKEAEEIVK